MLLPMARWGTHASRTTCRPKRRGLAWVLFSVALLAVAGPSTATDFRIGEVAGIAEVEPYVLRFWETEFTTLRPQKSRSNQRMYSRKDVEQVLRIRDLLYEEGFTISGARKQIKEGEAPENPLEHPKARGLVTRIRKEIEELLQLVDE